MRLLSFLLLLALGIASCSDSRNNFSVEVLADGSGNKLMYLAKRTINNTFVVDSALPEKSGKYILEGFAPQPGFYILYLNPRNYINVIIHPGDDFRVLTSASEFDRNYIVEGSKDSRLIQKLVYTQVRTLERITELSDRYEASRGRPDFVKIRTEIDSMYEKIFSEHRKFSLDLIDNNPESMAGLMALYQQLGKNQPVFDYRKDLNVYEKVDSNLTAHYPESEAVIDLNLKVSELREILKLEIGSIAPDIVLPDKEGTVQALSSLRGKYVLLIFWASWSTASVEQLSGFDSYSPASAGKDLEFYQVSLDRTRESWLELFGQKDIRGIHVSDLKYWDSPVVNLFHIEKLPATYLLNREGVIIQKGFTAQEFPEIWDKL